MAATIEAQGGRLGTIIHPAGILSPSAEIGAGTFIAAGAIVGVGAAFCGILPRQHGREHRP